jgi:ribosomal 50S subunit-associated protein YjgA (DUF615 family)
MQPRPSSAERAAQLERLERATGRLLEALEESLEAAAAAFDERTKAVLSVAAWQGAPPEPAQLEHLSAALAQGARIEQALLEKRELWRNEFLAQGPQAAYVRRLAGDLAIHQARLDLKA